MKRILVTGANGLLGQKISDLLYANSSYETLFCSRGESRLNPDYTIQYQSLNSTNFLEVKNTIDTFKPDAIINCAAYTHVDNCEVYKEDCHKGNVLAVENIIKSIGKKKIHVVHISTDFIFDGTTTEAYQETSKPNPLSEYGASKLKSEELLIDSQIDFTILRTVFVYGVIFNNSRSNFVTWAKSSLEARKEITVISDQYRPPCFAEDLAKACLLSVEKKATGIFHISGPETFSILKLIEMVADYWSLDKKYILPTKTSELQQKARRPKYTYFNLNKAKTKLGYTPTTFLESLKIIDEQINQSKKYV